MGGRRDYTRWDYDDETEITMEEQLTLEDNGSLAGSTESLGNATFPPLNVLSNTSPIRSQSSKRFRKTSMKEKAQLFVLSAGVLLVGFITGFGIGVRDRGTLTKHSKHFSAISDPNSHDHNDLIFHELLQQISAHNIRDNLKQMTLEEHRAGTEQGHSMAIAIRDLWRGFGVSVRVEQHKTLLTKTESFNYGTVISKNGTVLFTTSKIGDVNFPNSRPIVAFSPPADNINGTLLYGHYGHFEDFQRLHKSRLPLKGSIVLIRFGTLHPSTVVANAINFGCEGLIFYPDPKDFGPNLPKNAVRRTSLLTVGQVHDYQKRKGNWSIPSHTISANDAENLFKAMEGTEKAPQDWEGGLNVTYYLGGMHSDGDPGLVQLKIFNEAKTTNIFNVVAAIPGSLESDRYVIVGCSHDSWAGGGAGDPGIGLAMTTELLRVFSSHLSTGWRPRRSILVISWDANLFAASGVSHWLQEHHFEIANRAVAYIDMTRTLKGNQTLEVFSSPLLKEVARKSINKIKQSSPDPRLHSVQWKSVVSCDEPAYFWLGNMGIPFIRLSYSNAPKDYNYPLFHTAFDTFDNFVELVDSEFRGAEALGQIIAEIMVLLADSSALPITLHDYIKDIRKEYNHFINEYGDDFHKANLSYASFQAAVMRLELTADTFRAQSKNHTKSDNSLALHHRKLRREMLHRILNDKLISVERALLTRNSDSNDGFKHQIIGHVGSDMSPQVPFFAVNGAVEKLKPQEESHLVNKSEKEEHATTSTVRTKNKNNDHPRRVFSTEPKRFSGEGTPNFFPKIRAVLECGRSCESGLNGDACADSYLFPPISQATSLVRESNNIIGNVSKGDGTTKSMSCMSWRSVAAQRISSLVHSLDSVSSIILSTLVAQNHE